LEEFSWSCELILQVFDYQHRAHDIRPGSTQTVSQFWFIVEIRSRCPDCNISLVGLKDSEEWDEWGKANKGEGRMKEEGKGKTWELKWKWSLVSGLLTCFCVLCAPIFGLFVSLLSGTTGFQIRLFLLSKVQRAVFSFY